MGWNEHSSHESHGESGVRTGWVRRFFRYIEALKIELGRVSWTNRAELKLSTQLVIGSTFVFGFAIYGVDFVVKGALDSMAVAAQWLLG